MTNVISLARPRAAATVHTHAHTPDPTIARQAAIENALSMALHHVRGDQPGNLHAATAKANRAFSLLKQACAAERTVICGG
jgi:hypothetical protein